MSAFEVISAEEFDSAQASPPAEGCSVPAAVGTPLSDGTGGEELTYCEFCKGHYIAEYHVTRGGE